MFTISDAVTISLLLTDEGHFPQERKSGVAPCRRHEVTTGQEGSVGVGDHPFRDLQCQQWLSSSIQQTEGPVT